MDGRRMAGLEGDLWPPIARITSLFDQKIEKIWFRRPDMDGWYSGLSYEILWFEKAQKNQGRDHSPTLSVWLKTTSLFDEKRRKQKI